MQPKFLILVVDDDPMLSGILDRASRLSFAEASFIQVHSAAAAKTYINELDRHGPKLVLLDIDLGSDQTGFNFLAFLSSHQEARFLPVVMLTVDHLASTISEAYVVGASAYTVKPFSFADWQTYMATLRLYWFSTVTLPPIRFHKLEYWK